MRLQSLFRSYRKDKEIPVRVLAAQIGVSYSTLSRFENGGIPDGIDLAKLITWALTSETKTKRN